MKNLVIQYLISKKGQIKENSDDRFQNIPRSSSPEYLSNARYRADAALGPGNNGMSIRQVPALTELPFWWRKPQREEAINVVQKKKAG